MRNISKMLLLMLLVGTGGVYAQSHSAWVYGKITDTAGIPIEHVHISVIDPPSTASTATTEAGRYELSVPHNGEITVEVSHQNYLTQRRIVTVQAGKKTVLDLKMIPKERILDPVQVSAYKVDDVMGGLNPKLISAMPANFGGGIEAMVASKFALKRNNELSSQYNVRGGNYDENLIYLNGVEIHRPFLIRSGQQEGLSFINPDLVSAINFSSGGFDAVYGDKMSSVLDVQYKKPTQFGASISASLLGASGHLQGVSKNGKNSALLGVRYQSNGYVFRQMQTKGSYRPTFTDVQLLLNHHNPDSKWEFSLFGNFARNVYLFAPDSSSEMFGTFDEQKKVTGYFDGEEIDAFQTVFTSFITKYSVTKNNDLRLILSYFNTIEKETFDIESAYFMGDVIMTFGDSARGQTINNRDVGGDIHHGRNFLNAHIFHGEFRGEHRIKRSRLEWGIKGQGEMVDDRLSEWRLRDSTGYSLPSIPIVPSDSIGVPFDDSSRMIIMKNDFLKVHNSLRTFRTEGFIQNRWTFDRSDTSKVVLTMGIRASYWSFNNDLSISPRARLILSPNPNLSFYLATGLYYQPAFYKEMRLEDGTLNKNIRAQKSYHVIAGTNYFFKMYRRIFKFSTEAYYKYLWDLTTYNIDNVRILYSGKNDASGYAVGIDAKLSGEFIDNLESWVTVSLMQTKERLADSSRYTPRPTDQRFSMSVFFQDKIPSLPMLKAHINIFFSTGLPYCPPNIRSYQSYGKSYFRTDIGFSWQFIDAATYIGKKRLRALSAGYLTFEISNLFNYGNILSYSWVLGQDDYGRDAYYRVPNHLTPRTFNLKLRLEFNADRYGSNGKTTKNKRVKG